MDYTTNEEKKTDGMIEVLLGAFIKTSANTRVRLYGVLYSRKHFIGYQRFDNLSEVKK